MLHGTCFGREKDIFTLASYVDQGQRLVSLLGPAGIGNTRLAGEFAQRSTFSWTFIDLSEARTRAELLDALARSMDAPLGSACDGLHEIGVALASRGDIVVILDNFEHLVMEATVLQELLAAAPQARFLVTSREGLGLGSERVFEVGPLDLPGES